MAAVEARRSQVVLGLDPDPDRLWPEALSAGGAASGGSAVQAAAAVRAHCALVLGAAGPECVAVKLQVACFERLGAPGWAAMADTVAVARRQGLLVIADAKRGDIDVSARAYGQAFFAATPSPFGPVAGLEVDAMTANPLLGRDSLDALVGVARDSGGGLFVLVRTSNPGACDVQELELRTGGTVSDALAALVAGLGEAAGGGRVSDVGAVVGATAPRRLEALRAAMPRAPLLLPGIGAQGGRVEDLAAAFAPGPAGGLAAASRSIVNAHEQNPGTPADAARREAARVRELAWTLSGG